VPGGGSRDGLTSTVFWLEGSNLLFELKEASSWPRESRTVGSTPILFTELTQRLKPWPKTTCELPTPHYPSRFCFKFQAANDAR
jgi:hypothetical protein